MYETEDNYLSLLKPIIASDYSRRITGNTEVEIPVCDSQESCASDNQATERVKRNLFNTPAEPLNLINLPEDILLVAKEHPHETTCLSDVIIFPLEQSENEDNDVDSIATDNSLSVVETENEQESTEGPQDINNSTRKRKRHPESWKCNVRKQQREHGEEYINIKGKVMKRREVKTETCRPKCSFKCVETFSEENRKTIHNQFWKLTDTKKTHFFSKYVSKVEPNRKRTKKEKSRKQNVFQYYFEINFDKKRVCKEFFCNTLNISQQRVYYFFQKIQNLVTNVPRSPLKGKHPKRFTPPEKLDEVRNHIKSFPTLESHYCRASSKKKYLEATLNITKMYDLYRAKCNQPVTLAIYRKVFNTEFNLSFFRPKKDLCDRCEAFKVVISPSEDQQILQDEHLQRKVEGRTEKAMDKERNEIGMAVLTFDLENVFSLPKSEVSNFYYKSKLCVFNLTAHCNVNKTVYNCIWHEFLAGRDSNAIASAVIRILETLVDDIPNLTKIILWSDSCVPQNKNSIMSLALMHFIRNSNVEHIEQKFSEPGHGNLQDVDSAHSVIEKSIRNIDIYSPLGLVRMIMNIRSKNKFKVLQMKKENFLNYKSISSRFRFNDIPYSRIKHIMYDRSLQIRFKNTFSQEVIHEATLCRQRTPRSVKRRKDSTGRENKLEKIDINNIQVPMLKDERTISARKHKDLCDMLKYMEEGSDKKFYNTIIKNLKIKN